MVRVLVERDARALPLSLRRDGPPGLSAVYLLLICPQGCYELEELLTSIPLYVRVVQYPRPDPNGSYTIGPICYSTYIAIYISYIGYRYNPSDVSPVLMSGS